MKGYHQAETAVLPGGRSSVRSLIYVSLFACLIAIGAFIRVPVPVVPFTLQFLFTLLAGLLLGGKLGALSVALYIGLGLIGLPVFVEGGGIWYVLKPTFGYLIGFALGSLAAGKLVEKPGRQSLAWLVGANFLNLLIVYFMGLVYLYLIMNYVLGTPIGVWPVFLYGFIMAVPGDIALCLVAALLARRLQPILRIKR